MPWIDDGYLYHYTDAKALLSMVEQRKIWATQSDFLNDDLEDSIPAKILGDIIEKPDIFVDGTRSYESRYLSALEQQLCNGVITFVSAFSKKPNMLTQFRMYCPNTGGFVIGFPRDYLENAGQLVEVVYDHEDHWKWARNYFVRYISAAERCDMPGKEPGALMQDVEREEGFLNERCAMSVKFKSEEFTAEEEVRLVKQRTLATHVRPSISGSLLIPYIEIDLPNEDVQVKIAAGPGRFQTTLAGRSIGELSRAAERAGTKWQIGHLSIGKSGFRGMA